MQRNARLDDAALALPLLPWIATDAPAGELRMQLLEEEYGRVKTERQGLEIELARRGLLATAFDSDMCHPIMRLACVVERAGGDRCVD